MYFICNHMKPSINYRTVLLALTLTICAFYHSVFYFVILRVSTVVSVRLHNGHELVSLFVFLALQPIVVVFSQPGSGL
jgi:hypothetical protein